MEQKHHLIYIDKHFKIYSYEKDFYIFIFGRFNDYGNGAGQQARTTRESKQ
jgi:hypothetical protein